MVAHIYRVLDSRDQEAPSSLTSLVQTVLINYRNSHLIKGTDRCVTTGSVSKDIDTNCYSITAISEWLNTDTSIAKAAKRHICP